ncbi:MAG: HAD hydrolase family protein [Acidobacteriaceae bacterium]|nr:HAD hydrolase family protein [Acidobacteriaceae bacterium]
MPLDERLRNLTAVAFDVDGVLTDGRLTWTAGSAEEAKSFAFNDIMGISLLRRLGIKLALISGEPSPLVDRYAEKLRLHFVRKGTRDKATALRDFADTFSLDLSTTAFFGDDVNDLFAMDIAGLSCCPANAAAEVREYIAAAGGFIAPNDGGAGAVRDFADAILKARNLRGRDVFLLHPPE